MIPVYIIGAGLSGSAIAREFADNGFKVTIWERRNHIAGNMYDYIDAHGILVQKYGPHTFHTNDKKLYSYICRFEEWVPYILTCGASWNGQYSPTPFNFTTIDTFYSKCEAEKLKKALKQSFGSRKSATVVEVLENKNPIIRQYAEFLFKNDYAPYTAKQWGVLPEAIDPSILKRVPLRFSYEEGYFDDIYQVMPKTSFLNFFNELLNHPNITINLNVNALNHLAIKDNIIFWDNKPFGGIVIYTGPIDELFDLKYGRLPYRSLHFEWHYSDESSIQNAPVVAYPQEDRYTRITEYNKLPVQNVKGSSYAVEYPLQYINGADMEPYYPVLTEDSQNQYNRYGLLVNKIHNLYCCGRLGDFKYYNMDQALKRALNVFEDIISKID